MLASLAANRLVRVFTRSKLEEKAGSTEEQPGPLSQFPPLQSVGVGRHKRRLTYRTFGAPLQTAGEVVLYQHGTPSCHLEAATLHEEAERLGVAVVAPDRPGIGGSTYQRSLSITSFANDCVALLDTLGVGKVIVIGCSGGGPYAAGFAALYPARTEALGLVAPLAPTDWRRKEHRKNLGSMEGFDKFQMSMARGPAAIIGTPTLWLAHRAMRYMAEKHPATLLEYAPKGMSAVDGELMSTDPRVRDNFAVVLQYAYSGAGARGMGRDVKVLGRAWGVEVSGVSCRTLIWHGTEDKCVPLTHSRWYASQIKDHDLMVLEGEGHVTLPVRCASIVLEGLLAAAGGARNGTLCRTKAEALGTHVLGQVEEEALASRLSADLACEAQQALEEGNGSIEPSDSVSTPTESEEGSIRGKSSGPAGSMRLGSMALGSGPVGSGPVGSGPVAAGVASGAAANGSPHRAAVEQA